MKTTKKIALAALLSMFVVLCCLSVYFAVRNILPTMLSANLEEILAETLHQPVSIGRTAVKLFPGPAISISKISIGEPSKPIITAQEIIVRLSLWEALFGRIQLSQVEFEKPVISLDYDTLKKLDLGSDEGDSPSIKIRGGKLKLSGRDARTVIDNINGVIESDDVDLDALVLGGKTRLKAHNTDGWKGNLTSGTMDLSHISKDIKGTFGVNADFDLSGKKASSTIKATGEKLRLPWSEKEIPTFSIDLEAKGNEDALTLGRITVATPLVQVMGSGHIRDLSKGNGATVKLDMSSSTFVYEQIAELLPAQEFEPWLSELLLSQIRGGSSRFSIARYEGSLGDLITFKNFIDRIYVVEEIMGQSFGAGFGPERITGITGQVIFSHGDIHIRNLHGTMNNSTIEKVNLSFPGIMLPYWRIGTDVKVDMAARDFLDTWKAAGAPQYVYDLFTGISDVKGGRIAGDTHFWWDEEVSDRPLKAQGRVDLKNCTYTWGSRSIRNLSGSAVAESFDSPLKVTSRLTVGDRHIRSLALRLTDPFGEMRSSFEASVDGLISTESIRLGKGTTVLLKGTGVGPDISASAEAKSDSFTLFDTAYKVKGKPVRARTNLKGKLWPELSLALEGEAFPPSGRLSISGKIDEQAGKIRLKGLIDLGRFETMQPEGGKELSGSLQGDMSISWGKDVYVSGLITCRQAALPIKGAFLILDGPVDVAGTTLSGKGLKVKHEDLKMNLSNWSLIVADKPAFKGDVTLSGLTLPLPAKEGDTSRDISSYTAQGHLKILDLDFYGAPVEEANAEVFVRNGVLNLTEMSMQGASASAKGAASADTSGLRSFDVSFSLKNVSIHKFTDIFSAEQDWIRGDMSLDGHLSGRPDSINGTVNLVAKEGRLKKYALFSRVFALLNFYKIVQSRDLELTSKNFPYNLITSTFTITDSLVHFGDFHLDSNSVQFSAVGDYSLKNREINAILGVQPFETIDKAISVIPLVGWVLTGEKGRLIVLSMKIKGNIDDPSVKFAPIETVSDPVKKSLIRAMKLPSDLLEKSRNLLPGRKK